MTLNLRKACARCPSLDHMVRARQQRNNTMLPHQERVIAEKKELDERGNKLDQFILSEKFGTLPEAEQERMKRQLEIMGKYSEVLGERIAAF